jgi:hypothetical protein
MDLRAEANAPFFTRQTARMLFKIPNETKNNETINQPIVQGDLIFSLINGVRAGILRPFKNDDLQERMTYEEFMGKLEEKRFMQTQDYHVLILKKVLRFSKNQNQFLANQWFSKNLSANIEASKKSKIPIYYEVEALTILQPNGKPLATFSFDEVATNILLDNEECNYWVSKEKNQLMNMFDALNFNLFEAQLIQYQDNKSGKTIAIKSEAETQKLQKEYTNFPVFASKILFLQSVSSSQIQKVFQEYKKVK